MRIDNALVNVYGNAPLVPTEKGAPQKTSDQLQGDRAVVRVPEKNANPSLNNALREQAAKNYSQAQQQNSEYSYRSQRALSQYAATSQQEEKSRITEMLGIDDYA